MTGKPRGLVYAAMIAASAFAVITLASSRLFRSVTPAVKLADYGKLPAFSLVDQENRPFTRRSLEGSVWIVDFIFTRCAGQCPLMTQQMGCLSRQLDYLPDIHFASISVDPVHDTPQQLRAYAHSMQVEDPRWVFATGAQEAVFQLSRQGFHLGAGEEGPAQEPVTHSVRFALVDRQGHLRGLYDATDTKAMERLSQHARQLVKDRN